MQLPEFLQDRIAAYMDPSSVSTDFINSQKFYSLISESQQLEAKRLLISKSLNSKDYFNKYDQDFNLNFLIDNFDLKVYLENDIIVKQGDMAGDEENVYFILEGSANVILEKRDFNYFNLKSREHFLNEHEDTVENVDETTQDKYVKDLL